MSSYHTQQRQCNNRLEHARIVIDNRHTTSDSKAAVHIRFLLIVVIRAMSWM